MKTWSYRKSPFAILAAFTLLLGACNDSMTEHEEEHAEPEGVQLVMDGRVVASYDGEDQAWDGQLEVSVGAETPQISVNFVDHDGDPIETEVETYLDVVSDDDTIASFSQATAGGFTGVLRGNAQGQTGMSFRLMHGAIGQGHPDFVTTPVPVHVNPT